MAKETPMTEQEENHWQQLMQQWRGRRHAASVHLRSKASSDEREYLVRGMLRELADFLLPIMLDGRAYLVRIKPETRKRQEESFSLIGTEEMRLDCEVSPYPVGPEQPNQAREAMIRGGKAYASLAIRNLLDEAAELNADCPQGLAVIAWLRDVLDQGVSK
jgi:hypothetical protein